MRDLLGEERILIFYPFWNIRSATIVPGDGLVYLLDSEGRPKHYLVELKAERSNSFGLINIRPHQMLYHQKLQSESIKHIFIFAFYQKETVYLLVENINPILELCKRQDRKSIRFEDLKDLTKYVSEDLRSLIEQYMKV